MATERAIRVEGEGSAVRCAIAGAWTVQALRERREVQRRERELARVPKSARWDLSGLGALDAVGAQLLWHAWGRELPGSIELSEEARDTFAMLGEHAHEPPPPPRRESFAAVRRVGDATYLLYEHARELVRMLGQLLLDFWAFLLKPQRGPWREISAQVYHVGAQALGITALVGFLIGVVLSYLSAQQLALFGASIYIVDLLGISIVRELGPVLAAILVAGRSGSAITAQIGVMRVTQELDALSVMGISHGQRLVLPRVIALAVAMPLVVLWTDAMALIGGMVVADMTLDLSPLWFFTTLRDVISLGNFWIGFGKGILFGVLIALVACHYGLRIQPDTESLGRGTTASVVTSITAVILADAVCAIVFSGVGW
ncbi:ABC transporter permease [Verticiella sediminum]|uniref:ABC transporter permease n=1 Tax=Verticiella sediminum TaxID=1247510 RepID=A0A556AMN6_9BURK|nr:ABC transporter permease [Verticiella sediminum]TSH94154.1 ABC transporter permease [Verticiella sediminum]